MTKYIEFLIEAYEKLLEEFPSSKMWKKANKILDELMKMDKPSYKKWMQSNSDSPRSYFLLKD